MRPTLDDTLRALDDVAEQARSICIEIDDQYLRLIALAEALPENQPGADKTWVWRLDEAFREHYRHVTRA
jgi:hypothetical protein